MAFFKFRKAADEPASAATQPLSIEAMRQRAKYRLVGASVLVLLGVIGFPLLFDKQPRPIAVDTPIDIPDRNKVQPLTLPTAPAAAPLASDPVPVPAVDKPTQAAAVASEPGVITESAEKNVPVAKVKQADEAIKNIVKDAPKPAKPAADVVAVKPAEADKALALLDGKGVAESAGRFVVQVGAFADVARAREVRLKVEHAGLKTYTQVATTKDGKRIRVRVGPFATKAEAEKAAEKIKKIKLPAALLTL